MKKSFLLISFFILFTGFFSPFCFAKMLNLYDQPKADGKVIGTINSEAGIIPIFTPKEGGWIKVGDPANGNVGWLKQADLQSSTGVSILQNIISTGQGTSSYKTIQVPPPPQLTSEQTDAIVKRVRENQQEVYKAIQKMMGDMFNDTYQSYPMMVPIIIMPEQKAQPTNNTQTAPVKQK